MIVPEFITNIHLETMDKYIKEHIQEKTGDIIKLQRILIKKK